MTHADDSGKNTNAMASKYHPLAIYFRKKDVWSESGSTVTELTTEGWEETSSIEIRRLPLPFPTEGAIRKYQHVTSQCFLCYHEEKKHLRIASSDQFRSLAETFWNLSAQRSEPNGN